MPNKVDLSAFAESVPIECDGCMQSHCETCDDHTEAIKRIIQFDPLLKYARELEAEVAELTGALESISDATGKYDKAISAIAVNPDPDKMTSSCTIQDDDLDELYADMLIADERARVALAKYRKTQGEGGQDAKD